MCALRCACHSPSMKPCAVLMVPRSDAVQSVGGACMLRRLRDGRHPPSQEDQVCTKCHKLLAARWFAESATNRSGLHGSCLACMANHKRALDDGRRCQTPEQKQCWRCGYLLTADCFHRNKSNADGLEGTCKKCKNASNRSHKQALLHVEVPTKHCCSCDVTKPAGDFCRERRSVDGLAGECKECMVRRQRRLRGQ